MLSLRLRKDLNQEKNKDDSNSNSVLNMNLFTRFICHRIPERTFNVYGHYFPVCSRCTGFYIAAFSYFIFAYFVYVQYSLTLILLAIIMLIPAFLDGTTQLFRLRVSNNFIRLCTGLLGGVGLAIIIKAVKWMIIMG